MVFQTCKIDFQNLLQREMGWIVMATAVVMSLMSKEMGSFVLGDVGTASSYDPPYTPTRCNGYRADQFPPGNLFVAVSEGLWDNGAACGRRYRLRCLSGSNRPCKAGTVDVTVVDYCPKSPCPSTILLSNSAFSVISVISLRQNQRRIYPDMIRFLCLRNEDRKKEALVGTMFHSIRI